MGSVAYQYLVFNNISSLEMFRHEKRAYFNNAGSIRSLSSCFR